MHAVEDAVVDLRSAVLGASYALAGIRDPSEMRAAVAATLDGLVPGDSTGWVAWSPAAPGIIARWPANEAAERALGRHVAGLDHPVLLAIRAGRGQEVIRTSDLMDARSRRRSATFSDLYRVMGVRYQLVFPATRISAGTASTWALHRRSLDFDDDEVDLAARLAPLLAMVDRGVWPTTPSSSEAEVLTPRETQILRLLGSGMTTVQIGYAERISARTAAKHIEHIYAKLGVHDRVSAARAAVRLGLAVD
jgi:DNA-binding CsgD family transcriptional regulator